MRPTELLYVVFSLSLTVAGLSMVAFAVRAYRRTARSALFHLSVGFTLVVAASLGTTVSAFLLDFEGIRFLLSVNYLLSTIGYLFVIYSIIYN
ncbi:DUF7521 family protein [Haladaptatus salinisoli]|uniref:DUF7521 family protein n=1 Tax=Haladaptatus salinisoli TaxID=2884876 RepID=UPI001D0BCE2A|nr:hypothetical protein [Haladaptatus salinisoli]